MVRVMCVNKIRGKHNTIIGYRLRDENGKEMNFGANDVKEHIQAGRLEVINMTLTSDGRLINKKEITKVDKVDKIKEHVNPEVTIPKENNNKDSIVIDIDSIESNNQRYYKKTDDTEITLLPGGKLVVNILRSINDIIILNKNNKLKLFKISLNCKSLELNKVSIDAKVKNIFIVGLRCNSLNVKHTDVGDISSVFLSECLVKNKAVIDSKINLEIEACYINELVTNSVHLVGSASFLEHVKHMCTSKAKIDGTIVINDLIIKGIKDKKVKNEIEIANLKNKTVQLYGDIHHLSLSKISDRELYNISNSKAYNSFIGNIYNKIKSETEDYNNLVHDIRIYTDNSKMKLHCNSKLFNVSIHSNTRFNQINLDSAPWIYNGMVADSVNITGKLSLEDCDKIEVNNCRFEAYFNLRYKQKLDIIIHGDLLGQKINDFLTTLTTFSECITLYINYGTKTYDLLINKKYNIVIMNSDEIPKNVINSQKKEKILGINMLDKIVADLSKTLDSKEKSDELYDIPKKCSIQLKPNIAQLYNIDVTQNKAEKVNKFIYDLLKLLEKFEMNIAPFIDPVIDRINSDVDLKTGSVRATLVRGLSIYKIRLTYGSTGKLDEYIAVVNGDELINIFLSTDMIIQNSHIRNIDNYGWDILSKLDYFNEEKKIITQSLTLSKFSNPGEAIRLIKRAVVGTPALINKRTKELIFLGNQGELLKTKLDGKAGVAKNDSYFFNIPISNFELTGASLKPEKVEDVSTVVSDFNNSLISDILSGKIGKQDEKDTGLISECEIHPLFEIANKHKDKDMNILSSLSRHIIDDNMVRDLLKLEYFKEIGKDDYERSFKDNNKKDDLTGSKVRIHTLDLISRSKKLCKETWSCAEQILKVTDQEFGIKYYACRSKIHTLLKQIHGIIVHDKVNLEEGLRLGAIGLTGDIAQYAQSIYRTNLWYSESTKKGQYLNQLDICIDRTTGYIYAIVNTYIKQRPNEMKLVNTQVAFRIRDYIRVSILTQALDMESNKRGIMPFLSDLIYDDSVLFKELKNLQSRNINKIAMYRAVKNELDSDINKYLDIIGYIKDSDTIVNKFKTLNELTGYSETKLVYFKSKGVIKPIDEIPKRAEIKSKVYAVNNYSMTIKEYHVVKKDFYIFSIGNDLYSSSYSLTDLMQD